MKTESVRYDAMCRAIEAAHAIDEVKDIRDKVLAIEAYSHQARNKEAERRAAEIRIRAERKCGQLLIDMKAAGKFAKGGAPYHSINRTGYVAEPVDDDCEHALAEWKVSKRQSHEWQQVAAIPDERFEADMADPMWRPTTTGLLERQEVRERGPLLPPVGDDDCGA